MLVPIHVCVVQVDHQEKLPFGASLKSSFGQLRCQEVLPPSSPAHVRGITVAIRILSAVARILLCGLVNMEDGVRHVHGERHLSALQRKIVKRNGP